MSRPRPRPIRISTEAVPDAPERSYMRSGGVRESRSDSAMRQSQSTLGRLPSDMDTKTTRSALLTADYKPVPLARYNTPISGVSSGMPSPPSTPPTRSDSFIGIELPAATQSCSLIPDNATFDLEGCQVLGSGLWSDVYRVEVGSLPVTPTTAVSPQSLMTPPSTPQKPRMLSTSVFAVKSASRPDSRTVFREEAQTLQYIQQSTCAASFVVPFYGMANNDSALVFHCADLTLDTYAARFADSSSLPSLLTAFSTIATQLINGLSFLHSIHLVHADIKPANILLDLDGAQPLARFADFSASHISPLPPSNPLGPPHDPLASPASSAPCSRSNSVRASTSLAGGTWTFMAPEQLLSNPLLNEPSYASDVYALGATLLTFLLGARSPFIQVEGQNIFLLREAIKMGNPLSFARGDPVLRKRVKDLEGDVRGADALRLVGRALRKKGEERVRAAEWA